MKQCKQSYEEELERIIHDREKLRRDLELSKEEIVNLLHQEKDEMLMKFDKEKEFLHQNLNNLAADRDNALLNAENEKQQVGPRDRASEPSFLYIYFYNAVFSFY